MEDGQQVDIGPEASQTVDVREDYGKLCMDFTNSCMRLICQMMYSNMQIVEKHPDIMEEIDEGVALWGTTCLASGQANVSQSAGEPAPPPSPLPPPPPCIGVGGGGFPVYRGLTPPGSVGQGRGLGQVYTLWAQASRIRPCPAFPFDSFAVPLIVSASLCSRNKG